MSLDCTTCRYGFILDTFRLAPKRWQRLRQHGLQPKNVNWLVDGFWLSLELIGVCDVYEGLASVAKWKTRPLTPAEIELAIAVYGSSIDYHKVRIDETAWLGARQYRFCYVSFNTINTWQPMWPDTFIHELMHVWQYQHLGAAYISRALRAQRSAAGYNYGGVVALRRAQKTGKRLLDFNYEQQADIVADYFRLKNGWQPRWGRGTAEDLEVYAFFVGQLRE